MLPIEPYCYIERPILEHITKIPNLNIIGDIILGLFQKMSSGGVGGNDFSVRYPVVKNKKYVRRPVV